MKSVGWTSLAVFASLVLASGCGSDRFEDAGCDSDEDCRAERICEQNRCIYPQHSSPQADGGGDAVNSEDDADDDPIDDEQLIGLWSAVISGQITNEEGQTEEIEEEVLPLEIARGDRGDLDVRLGEESTQCQLPADRTPDGFSFLPDGCSMEDDLDGEITFRDVSGTGRLDQEAEVLHFDLEAEVEYAPPDAPTQTYDYELEGEAVRED